MSTMEVLLDFWIKGFSRAVEIGGVRRATIYAPCEEERVACPDKEHRSYDVHSASKLYLHYVPAINFRENVSLRNLIYVLYFYCHYVDRVLIDHETRVFFFSITQGIIVSVFQK